MMRRTKIVATLGPASDRPDILDKLIEAGVDVVRLNFSHGTPDDHRQRAVAVRSAAAKAGRYVAILGDLQGPKIRVGKFLEGAVQLQEGEDFVLDPEAVPGQGDEHQVSVDYKDLYRDCRPGDTLLLDDGRLRLSVESIQGRALHTRVLVGGRLSNNKGINRLGGGLTAPALTDKDLQDIKLAAELDLDYLAVSFPRDAADMQCARALLQQAGGNAHLVAKVERAEAVADPDHLNELIIASDVIMVARGDLAVEIGDAALMGVQKDLIKRARSLNRVVITATQMMESMIESPVPTRAEVCDVANAVLDGTDAVMLSAETAAGRYPVETVRSMADVITGAEKHHIAKKSTHRINSDFEAGDESIAMAAMYVANHFPRVRAIICQTETGNTALLMSRVRSGMPIYAFARHARTCGRVALYRGVGPVLFQNERLSGVERDERAIAILKEQGVIERGDYVLVSRGYNQDIGGSTDTLRVVQVR